MKRYVSVASGTSWRRLRAALRLTPSPKRVGVFCLGMHEGQDLEKLVFLGLGSPLVKRRVSEDNVNTGLP